MILCFVYDVSYYGKNGREISPLMAANPSWYCASCVDHPVARGCGSWSCNQVFLSLGAEKDRPQVFCWSLTLEKKEIPVIKRPRFHPPLIISARNSFHCGLSLIIAALDYPWESLYPFLRMITHISLIYSWLVSRHLYSALRMNSM